MDSSTLAKKSLAELRQIAEALALDGFQRMKKADLVELIVHAGQSDNPETATDTASEQGDDAPQEPAAEPAEDGADPQKTGAAEGRQRQRTTESVSRSDTRETQRDSGEGEDAEVREGVLDLLPEGYGFLRVTGYLAGARDVYVSQSVVRRLDLRPGDRIQGPIRRNKNTDKFPALARVDRIESSELDPQELPDRRPQFVEQTIVDPVERFAFTSAPDSPESLVYIDTFAPLARGQRGLIVGAPGTGKSTVLSDIAGVLTKDHPDVTVMLLLLDERPEALSVASDIQVVSTCEQPPEDHTQIAELALERAKRLVERGEHVVVLLDSITRLARAYQATAPLNARTIGGLDVQSLGATKRFFAQARAFAEGGSLTVIATATDDSVLDADRLLINELEQVATVSVHLDRNAAERRAFPAVDPVRSYAHRAELLRDENDTDLVDNAKRALTQMSRVDAVDAMHAAFRASATVSEALRKLA